ncbi:hypothetical protein ACROYT_G029920 [Oculina patagonica]
MADDSPKAANMARVLAIVHIIVGFLLFCFGIADRAVGNFWMGHGCFGIWIGVWMCIAGGLGIPGTRKERSTSRNSFAGVFMGFSITSAVFGGIIIICYSISIAVYRDDYRYDYRYGHGGYTRGKRRARSQLTPAGGQPQMVMVPVSGAGSYQPQLAQVAPAGAMATGYQPQLAQVAPAGAMATGYQPQQAEMPPSYGQGQYMTQQNAQMPVKT